MSLRLPKGYSHSVKLAAGGFGSVYRARQNALGRYVAIKYIEEKDAQARSALKKEASLQADLRIPGIPQVYDVQEMTGKICIIMQWINGCDLRMLMEQKQLIPESKFAIAAEIIKITASLHERGYAHRDIKPENIIISGEGVFLIDFGLAHHVNDVRRTMPDMVKGTPAYIAPELWQGGKIDQICADVYSLGKVVRELLGKEATPECIQKCLEEDPALRLRSSIELFHEWELSVPARTVTWADIAEPCSSRLLAGQLLAAAGVLAEEHRAEEAYELLVECLKIDPESPGAMLMMEHFPAFRKKRAVSFLYIPAAVSLLVAAGISVFLFLRVNDRGTNTRNTPEIQAGAKGLIIKAAGRKNPDITFPMKENTVQVPALNGHVRFVSNPSKGSLQIDGKPCVFDSGGFYLPAPSREHRFAWRAEDGSIYWKETIRALPFEEKRICIREK